MRSVSLCELCVLLFNLRFRVQPGSCEHALAKFYAASMNLNAISSGKLCPGSLP